MRRRNWTVWMAFALTGVWLFLGLLYIADLVGTERFLSQSSADLGGFLEGAFAPLAFLWLVIGQFQQQRELAANNDAIRLQYEALQKTAEHAEAQARAISANELHARQDTFMEMVSLVGRQCGVSMGFLYGSSQGPAGPGPVSGDDFTRMWTAYGSGDPEIFARGMLVAHLQCSNDDESYALFYGTPVRTRHCEVFQLAYSRLLRHAAECDPDGMITDALLGGGFGPTYRLILRHRDRWIAEGRQWDPKGVNPSL